MLNLKTASILGLIIAVAALVTLIFKESLFANGAVAITIQVLAALLMIWARITFGLRSFHAAANPTEGGLVTTGPYHYVRHPIYASVLLFFGAAIAAHPSWINAGLGLIMFAALLTRMLSE